MDKGMKERIKKLERGYELAQEDAMRGSHMAQAVGYGEELEDKLDTVERLEKQIKVTRGISLGALLVLVIVLLYACAAAVVQKDEPVQEPPAEAVVQDVSDVSLFYRMEVPDIDVSKIGSTTLEELVAGLSGHDFLDYLGTRYFAGSEAPSGVLVYSMSSLEELVGRSGRKYVLSQPLEEKMPKTFLEIGCSVHNFIGGADGTYQELPSDFYYNPATIEAAGLADGGWDNYLSASEESFRLTVYGEADVERAVKDALEGRTYGETLEGIADDIVRSLSGAEFSIKYGDFSYNTYDSVEERDGSIVCIRGTEEVTPTKVVNYDVTVADYGWNLWVCAAQEAWY